MNTKLGFVAVNPRIVPPGPQPDCYLMVTLHTPLHPEHDGRIVRAKLDTSARLKLLAQLVQSSLCEMR